MNSTPSFQTFNDLSLPEPLRLALEKMRFTVPTPVQAEAIPPAREGKDVLGTAQTGTGKTGAFCIPLLEQIYNNRVRQALILAPTRELAAQIHEVLRQMGKGMNIYGAIVVGGESFNRQADDLYRGVDYIVATPGRLNDHLMQGTVKLSDVEYLVLDEVDRMLDMGFAPQIKKIMAHVPQDRQTLLFSATLPKEIQSLAASFLYNPVRVAVGPIEQPISQVVENTIRTTDQGKNGLIVKETSEREGRILVFARTKHRTDRLARLLSGKGHAVVSLHGGRSQAQRKQALERFRAGTHRIMVATDLAGRGIDVNDIAHVINYDLPMTREDYIHRIGRTGRYGKSGQALNLLVSGDRDQEMIVSGETRESRVVYKSRSFRGRRSR